MEQPNRTEYPLDDSREGAYFDFLLEYQLANGGRSPTLRDFREAKVGQDTPEGALASISGARSTLNGMAGQGWIEFDPKESRTAQVAGGRFIVPENIRHRRGIDDYENIIVCESAGTREPINSTTIETMSLLLEVGYNVMTHSATIMEVPEIWDALNGADIMKPHLAKMSFIMAAAFTMEEKEAGRVAVITSNMEEYQIATAAGLGVFLPEPE